MKTCVLPGFQFLFLIITLVLNTLQDDNSRSLFDHTTKSVNNSALGFQAAIVLNDSPYHTYLPMLLLSHAPYYVSPMGDDSNPGTFALPWRTISKAADSVIPGDIVFIRGGTYHERVVVNQSGNQYQPIRFYNYSGEIPIIDGENELPASDGEAIVNLRGDWIELMGIEVKNSRYWGIVLFGEHVTVSDVFVHHSSRTGIYMNGDYGIVQDSRIWQNSIRNEYGQGPSVSSGLAASRDLSDGITDYAIIRRNEVWENWGQGIDTYESNGTIMENNISHDNYTTNIYISDSTNVLCQRNFVYMDPSSVMNGYGSNDGIMVGDETDIPSSANVLVINNIAYGNHPNFILLRGANDGRVENVLIAFNTFVNAIGDPDYYDAGVVINNGDRINVRFENNLVQQDGELRVIDAMDQTGVTYSYNLWSKTPDADASGIGDIIADPLLKEVGEPFFTDWFRLMDTSPAIGAALSLSDVLDDYFGNLRDSAPDIGAIEFISD